MNSLSYWSLMFLCCLYYYSALIFPMLPSLNFQQKQKKEQASKLSAPMSHELLHLNSPLILFVLHLLQPSKFQSVSFIAVALQHPVARQRTSVIQPLISMLTPTWLSSLILTRKRFSVWHQSLGSFGCFVSNWLLNLHRKETVPPFCPLPLFFSADSCCQLFLQRSFTPSVCEIV